MKKNLLSGILIFLSFALSNQSYPQKDNSIKLESILVNENVIPQGTWGKILLKVGDKIMFTITPPQEISGVIKYKAYLNGNIIEPVEGFTDNLLKLNGLPKGAYIVKILAFTNSGWESNSLIQQFEVKDASDISPVTVKVESESSIRFLIMKEMLVFIVSIICIIQFIVIIILVKRKKTGLSEGMNKNLLQEEFSDLKYAYNRLKSEIQTHIEENNYLQKKIKDLEVQVTTLESANGNLVQQKQKLTESKTQLEELQSQKEDLFVMAIHDIKNPASAIRGCIDLLNSYDLNANEQQEIMSSLMISSENIVKLSQNMCQIMARSKPEPSLNITDVQLKTLIDEVCLNNKSYAKAKKIRLLNKSSIGLPDIKADASKIQEAIDNLINNALKYSPPETVVEIRTYVKNKSLLLNVIDNGVGLTAEDLKLAFQKGAVLSAKPTGMEKSSGLGLWSVKKIVEEHKGRVWVESKPGIGSTFGIEMPL
jgi:signal transduction histidine kinase